MPRELDVVTRRTGERARERASGHGACERARGNAVRKIDMYAEYFFRPASLLDAVFPNRISAACACAFESPARLSQDESPGARLHRARGKRKIHAATQHARRPLSSTGASDAQAHEPRASRHAYARSPRGAAASAARTVRAGADICGLCGRARRWHGHARTVGPRWRRGALLRWRPTGQIGQFCSSARHSGIRRGSRRRLRIAT